MRWKRVAWGAWLAAAAGGCHTTGPAGVPALPSGGLVGHTQAAIEHRIRTDAREAWRCVRAEYPRRAFTAEFHDGFLDGYSDHLDRGGDGTPPPTPPIRYTRHARYFTPEGHVLLKDYFLGFKYGADVAAATGNRQYLTVPVLVPDGGPAPLVVEAPATPPSEPTQPPTEPLPPPRPMPTTARPPARPAGPTPASPDGSKFDYVAPLPLPVPFPVTLEPVGLPTPRLPEPPAAVPTLPAHVPTPPVTDDLPVFSPQHDLPPFVIPPTHPEPTR